MVNLIGSLPLRDAVLALPEAHWHDYGKAPRPGRKVGHVTLLAPTAAQRDKAAQLLLRAVDPASARTP
jgi:5-(carboxyamino)imidazole ribonucleotide synthase